MKLKLKEVRKIDYILAKVDQSKNDKLTYAIKRSLSSFKDVYSVHSKQYNKRIKSLNVEFASVDEFGNLIEENDKFKYTKENRKKLEEAAEKLSDELQEKEYDLELYLCSDRSCLERLDEFLQEEIQFFFEEKDKTKKTI